MSLQAKLAYNLGSAHANQANNDLYGKASQMVDENLGSFEDCLTAIQQTQGNLLQAKAMILDKAFK